MTASYLMQQVINGLTLGSMYALIAIGFSMIYGIVRLINFAHGDVVMMGAFSTLALALYSGLPWPVIALCVLAIGALAGMVIETLAFRPMRGAPQVTGFIASLAVSVVIQNLSVLMLTAQPRNFLFPDYMRTRVPVGPATTSIIDILIIGTTLVLMVGLVLLVKRTKLGMGMRATAENLQAARLMGINPNRVILVAFALGSSLAAIAGLMWGGKYGQIDPLFGFIPGLKAFVAAVIGGIGSIPGAMLGGYLLGLAEILFVGLLPPGYSPYRDAFVFGTLIVVLLVLPNGLLGRGSEDRA